MDELLTGKEIGTAGQAGDGHGSRQHREWRAAAEHRGGDADEHDPARPEHDCLDDTFALLVDQCLARRIGPGLRLVDRRGERCRPPLGILLPARGIVVWTADPRDGQCHRDDEEADRHGDGVFMQLKPWSRRARKRQSHADSPVTRQWLRHCARVRMMAETMRT